MAPWTDLYEVAASHQAASEGFAATDCRSAEGITVGLIDGMIAMARIIESRAKDSHAVRQALSDFGNDESIASMLASSQEAEGKAS